jgi:hypothetical protein
MIGGSERRPLPITPCGQPPSEREPRVEQSDVGKSCIPQQRFVLLRGQDRQPFTDGRDCTFRVRGWYAGRHRKGGIAGEPFRLLSTALRKAVVGNDEWSTGPQPSMHLGQRASAFVFRNEVEGQEAGCRIERSDGCAVDIAFMEVDARSKWTEIALGQTQHLRRRIDAAEAPSGLRVGKGFQLQPAAGANDEHTSIASNSFGEKHTGHPL